jgi:hypothetical protein
MEQVEQEAFGPKMAPPNEGLMHHIGREASNFGGAAAGAIPEMLMHPVKTVQSVAHMAEAAQGDPTGMANDLAPAIQAFKEHPEESAVSMAGNLVGGAAAAPALEGAAGMAGDALTGIRDAAIGDPNVAALKGLRVPPSSAKSLSTLKNVEGARPYLKGAQSLEDVQARVPEAKNEIWGPYQKTVDAIGDKQVRGPDGPTTVRDLENERLQISANLRALKGGGPEAVQLASQKGMNQADLLAREKAVQSALDPHLEQAGIDPKLIRQTFSNVAQVGGRVAGKSTMAEPSQPYGLGRMANIKLNSPKTWLGEPMQGVRDMVAGRPMWSGKPTDINLREAFRSGGEKPDFRAPYTSMPRFEFPPKQLEANVPGNANYGDIDVGSMSGIPHPGPQVGMAPPTRLALPSSTGAGEAQPMIRFATPYVEPYDPHFKPLDVEEYKGQRHTRMAP